MRKILFGLLIVSLAASMSLAYPATSGEVTNVPIKGLWMTHLSSYETLGAKCQIGANTFQYIRNMSGQSLVQGEPVFTSLVSADGYTVTTYEAGDFNLYEFFQGVVYCDKYGGTTIDATDTAADGSTEATSRLGWIVTEGVARAYVSGEGTDIAVGDVLQGFNNLVSTDVNHLQYGRGFWTSSIIADQATNEAASEGNPRALEASGTANTVRLIKVLLRP
jgi:hypothetical protein